VDLTEIFLARFGRAEPMQRRLPVRGQRDPSTVGTHDSMSALILNAWWLEVTAVGKDRRENDSGKRPLAGTNAILPSVSVIVLVVLFSFSQAWKLLAGRE
jgi:hypothetical protein